LKSARPRDLSTLRDSLGCIPQLHTQLAAFENHYLAQIRDKIGEHADIFSLLSRSIIENPPVLIRDGSVVATGYDQELDELRSLKQNSDQFLIDLEIREKERSGIATLKVGYNRIHGYYIEVSRGQSEKVPDDYIRRQTLKSAERYITPELKSFEDKILSAKERALAREKAIYDDILDKLNVELVAMQQSAEAISELDVLSNLAERAITHNLCRPELVNEPGLHICEGRHPVVEQVSDQPFVANDVSFAENRRMLIITGPNMGGKSTYMRQTALITLLAYSGSFVPARSARIGPIDRIFTRIGASDDLAGGRSTFMVEMTETANILNNATDQSLVLMDEVGRGTSTFDGLALAWACAENLAQEIRAFTLFATHYFELTSLPETHDGIANVHLTAAEHENTIIFLHTVKEGPASQSYGLQVAGLAGVPKSVLNQAHRHLARLENTANADVASHSPQQQLPLFVAPVESRIEERLDLISPDELTPRQALDLLYELKQMR